MPAPGPPVVTAASATPVAFDSSSHVVLLSIAYLLTFGPEAVDSLRRDEGDDVDAVERDRYSKWVLVGCLAVGGSGAFVVAGAVPAATVAGGRGVVFGLGLALMLLGAGVRQYAIRTLGRYFTRTVKVRPAQQVVAEGPYSWVRHPSYAGSLLSFLGLGLAFANWASVGLLCVAALAGYGYRIRVEERALRTALGEPYEAYRERTPYRLVPYVW